MSDFHQRNSILQTRKFIISNDELEVSAIVTHYRSKFFHRDNAVFVLVHVGECLRLALDERLVLHMLLHEELAHVHHRVELEPG